LAPKGFNLSKRLHELNRHEHCMVGKMQSSEEAAQQALDE